MMVMSNLNLYRIRRDHIRENLNKYTIKAFNELPKIENPQILDVGCGTGIPTVELAKISEGNITGLDNDVTSLKMLQEKIDTLGLNKEIKIVEDSIFTMDFPRESFDIIWAEGSVFVMGFENSIMEWRRFLKLDGFLVIHDDNIEKNEKLELIEKYGYKLVHEFDISHQAWLDEYYRPLGELIAEFREKYPDDLELVDELHKDRREIDENFSRVHASSFIIIIQKI